MHQRQNELTSWLESHLKFTPITLEPLAGDASFRRYFRLNMHEKSYVVMDAPPEKESVDTFLFVGNLLTHQGIHAPKIYAVDRIRGFILLEDLGDMLLLKALNKDTVHELYQAAMQTIHQMQRTQINTLPIFDEAHILQELSLFQDWFLKAYLGLNLCEKDVQLLSKTFEKLTSHLLHQPQAFIHRDFHARNILIRNINPLALSVIDFQDAMVGPITYDLVSLLKDCYIHWPREQIQTWVIDFYQELKNPRQSLEEFTLAFELCGLQRHLKVLGIFCRLYLRDNKRAYLDDLPLTFHHVKTCLSNIANIPEYHAFSSWMEQKVQLPFTKKMPA